MNACRVMLALAAACILTAGCSLVIDTEPAQGCSDQIQNGDETDIDCGGLDCPPCDDGLSCAEDGDCLSGLCEQGVCITDAGTCGDGLMNQDETDVDCGGLFCDPCGNGSDCLADGDCLSGYCAAGTCSVPDLCGDGTQNGDETDVDCGGSCPGCPDGDSCAVDGDCLSGSCVSGSCAAANCSDGVQNQAETDVDCGGGDCDPCADERGCLLGADCANGFCFPDMLLCGDAAADEDGDDVLNGADNCPIVQNPNQDDWDGDGSGDACDDSDGDGVLDDTDLCVSTFNPGQENRDGDGDELGDHCDPIQVEDVHGLAHGEIVFLRQVVVVTWPIEGFYGGPLPDSTYPDLYWVAAHEALDQGGVAIADRTIDVDVWPALLVDVVGLVRTDLKDHSVVQVIERRSEGTDAEMPGPVVATVSQLTADPGAYAGQVVSLTDAEAITDAVAKQPFTVVPIGGGAELQVGDLFGDHRHRTGAPQPQFTSLTGVVELDGGAPVLQPRWCDDLVVDTVPACGCPDMGADAAAVFGQLFDRARANRIFQGCPVDLDGIVITAVQDEGVFVQRSSYGLPQLAIFALQPQPSGVVGNLAAISQATYRVRMGRMTLDLTRQGDLADTGDPGVPNPVSLSDLDVILPNTFLVRGLVNSYVSIGGVQISDTRGPDYPNTLDDYGDFQIVNEGGGAHALTVGWMFRHGVACPEVYADELGCSPNVDFRIQHTVFTSMSGILTFTHGRYRLEPRGCADFNPMPAGCLDHPDL